MKVFHTNSSFVRVGPVAEPDALVVMKIPDPKMSAITAKILANRDIDAMVISRLYWDPKEPSPNSLIAFPAEYKSRLSDRNQNQLLMDFLTAHSQRRAFGLPDMTLWGAVISGSLFTVYSSRWDEGHVCLTWFLPNVLPFSF